MAYRAEPQGEPTGVLVGRARERAQLITAVERTATGSAVAVEVVGEPGIGKTRMLDELSAIATREGLAVHSAVASELGSGRRCAPFADAVPSVSDLLGDGGDADVAVWRYQVGRAVSSALESLAGDRGLLLVLDDFHRADEESFALLGHLLRRPPRAGVVLAVGYRGRQASGSLLAALSVARLPRWRLELGPLHDTDATALSGGRTEIGHLGGNPRLLLAVGDNGARGAAARAALSAEFAGLNRRELLVVCAAAVAGDQFEPEFVARIAGEDTSVVQAALAELSRRDIVRQVERSPRWAFRHPMVREAAYPSVDELWLADAHARADELLARRHPQGTLRAKHAATPERADSDAARIAVLVDTAREAFRNEPAAAVQWFRTVLDGMPESERDAAGLMLAQALLVDGRLSEAKALIEDLVATIGRDSDVDRALVLGVFARTARLMGHHVLARWLSVAELVRVPVMSQDRAHPLLVEIAAACVAGGEFDTARLWAAMVVGDAGTDLRHRSTVAGAAGLLALAHDFVGEDAAAAPPHRTRSAELVDGMVDVELLSALDAVVWVGWAEILAERYGEAFRHFGRGLAVAREHGHNHVQHQLLIGMCTTKTLIGRLDEAWALATEAEAAATLLGCDEPMVTVLSLKSQIAMLRGHTAEAVETGERAVSVAADRHVWWAHAAAATLAAARLSAGDAERAASELLEAGRGPGLPALPAAMRPGWYSTLTAAELRQDRIRAAEDWASRAGEAAGTLRLAGQNGFAALAHASVLRARGSTKPAAEMAGTAAESFGMAGMRLYEGRARLLAGVAHGEVGDVERAQRDLSYAKVLFVDCAAHGSRDRAVNELRRLGARRPRQGQRSAGLTARESEIAALVGKGLTNREIAARVRLSEKTVETHLGKAFRKLGVSTRAGLVARVADLEA